MDAVKLATLKTLLAGMGASDSESRRIIEAARSSERDRALTTRDAAQIIGCHPKSVHRYARRGLLNPIRRSARTIRWRESEVAKLALG